METKRDRILSICISVFLHLLIVATLVYVSVPAEEQKEEKRSESSSDPNILSEKSSKSETVDEVFDVDIVDAVSETAGEDCTIEKSSYTGIGIMHTFSDQLIIQAPKDYPAGKAGIQVGDTYVNSSDKDGYRDVVISRDGVIMNFHIKMQPICYQ